MGRYYLRQKAGVNFIKGEAASPTNHKKGRNEKYKIIV